MPYREATASQNALLAFAHGVPVITTTAGALAEAVRDGVGRADLRAGRREGSAPRAGRDQRTPRPPGGCGPGQARGPGAGLGCLPAGFCCRLAPRRPEEDRPMASPAPAQARSPTVITTREASATTSADPDGMTGASTAMSATPAARCRRGRR